MADRPNIDSKRVVDQVPESLDYLAGSDADDEHVEQQQHGLSAQGAVDALNRAAETGKFADI